MSVKFRIVGAMVCLCLESASAGAGESSNARPTVSIGVPPPIYLAPTDGLGGASASMGNPRGGGGGRFTQGSNPEFASRTPRSAEPSKK